MESLSVESETPRDCGNETSFNLKTNRPASRCALCNFIASVWLFDNVWVFGSKYLFKPLALSPLTNARLIWKILSSTTLCSSTLNSASQDSLSLQKRTILLGQRDTSFSWFVVLISFCRLPPPMPAVSSVKVSLPCFEVGRALYIGCYGNSLLLKLLSQK